MPDFSYALPYASSRSPLVARNVVATSQPLAVQAGLKMLQAGGNAVDAALASAITLTVVEPTANGLGSDAFAIVWDGRELHGLDASGRAPAAWHSGMFAGHNAMPRRGWGSVTVPGAISAWVALSERFGCLPFEALFEPALSYAREGFLVSPHIASTWARIASSYDGQPGFRETFLLNGRAPRPGDVFKFPHIASSLEAIAKSRGAAFYSGQLAERMVTDAAKHHGVLTMGDLASHRAEWCGTLAARRKNLELHEIPPAAQGIAALIAFKILKYFEIETAAVDSAESLHLQIESMKLGLADTEAFVADRDIMNVSADALLDDDYIASRAACIDLEKAGDPGHGVPAAGGTVYVTTADAEGMMVSYIQSNYEGFGSGVVVPETGISLHNRGYGFSLDPVSPNFVSSSRRPYHTIIPGFVMNDGKPAMSFGIMGGPMQAQGHLQLLLRTMIYGQNPQSASDAPRWRIVGGRRIAIETGVGPAVIEKLAALGHVIQREPPEASWGFGGAQLICRIAEGYLAGSDHRKDGYAAGF